MKRLLPFVGVLLAFVALACFEQDYLWTVQEQNLFLHTPLFFQQCMVASGGLLSWAGTYLTQFFYYPVLGAGLLCLLWAFLMLLLKRAFCIPTKWMWLTLVPVAMLLLTDVGLGYWIYFLKLRGHFFVGTLGVMSVAILVWTFRRLSRRGVLSILFIAGSTLVSYPLFGFYGLLATLLMGLMLQGERWHWVGFLVAVASVVVVPIVYYYTFYHQTPFSNIYWTALPIFVHNGVSTTWYNAPYGVIVSWLGLASLRRKLPVVSFPHVHTVGVGVLFFVVLLGWYKDDNFHRELTMRRSMERQDWPAMLATIKDAKGEPTRALCMMKNLALQRTGRLSLDFGKYPDGFGRPDAPFLVHTVHTVGKMLYLQLGLPNYCYRWCMEDGVEYGWTAEALKLMVKCSLLNGEMMAAQRYLSLLKKTTFHDEWARHYEAYLRQPRLMGQDAELKAVFPLLRDDDFLTSDQSQLELFLIEQLASAPGDTPEQRELGAFCYRLYFKRYQYVEK